MKAGGVLPFARVVWPTLAASLPAFSRGKGMLTIAGGKNTMTGPSDAKCRELQKNMGHNIMHSAQRINTLHHVKMAAGIVHEHVVHEGGGAYTYTYTYKYTYTHTSTCMHAGEDGRRDCARRGGRRGAGAFRR